MYTDFFVIEPEVTEIEPLMRNSLNARGRQAAEEGKTLGG
jgi:hypothetical protein